MTDVAEQIQDAAEASDDIADAIRRIDDAVQNLLAAGLERNALIALIKAQNSYLRRGDIIAVLDALANMRGWLKE